MFNQKRTNKSMKNFKLKILYHLKELSKYDLKMKLTILFLSVSLFQIQANNDSRSLSTKITLTIENTANTIPTSTNIIVQQSISGTITDNNGLPLSGASVIEKGTSNGAITDFDGNYTLTVSDDTILVVSYLGYVGQEVSVNGRSTIDIIMEEDASQLDEIILIGYGQQKAKDVTGAVKLISAKDFNGGVTNSPGQLLQGKVAGVNVTASSGEPGADIIINIRGVSSLGTSSEPLFVVDGIPLDGGGSPGEGFGRQRATRQSPLNFLNSSDIKSMTILKDASATAIYGTRGANGVVLIETYKGKSGESVLTYDNYVSSSVVANRVNLFDGDGFRAALADFGLTDKEGRAADANFDYQDLVFRTAIAQNHKLSYSGGSDKTTFYASLGYTDQEGIIKTTGLEKITEHISVNTSVLNDIIKIRGSITASQQIRESQATGGEGESSIGNLLTAVVRAAPTQNPFTESGVLSGAREINPLIYLASFRDHTELKTFLANVSFDTDLSFITEGLSFKVNLGFQNSDSDRGARFDSEVGTSAAELIINTFETSNKLIENYLNYDRTFNNLTINALLGTSYQEFNNKGLSLRRKNFTVSDIDPLYNIGVASDERSTTSFTNERKLQSYFGRVNLSLSDKYVLTASLRVDGSSVFGRNERFGYFPSAAFGWNITNEDFLKDSKIFSNLKLRLGWGQTGNQAIPVKVTQASFAASAEAGYNFGSEPVNGVIVARQANPDLKWETTTQTNIGLDWSLFGGKVSGTIDYFNKTTEDLFLEVAAPSPAIVGTVFVNTATEIENTGLELAIDLPIIKTEDFRLDFGGNVAFLDNEISGLAADIEVGVVTGPGASNENSNVFRSGESVGAFFLKRFLGTFDENGTEELSANKEIVGDALPDMTYGFYFNAKYKRWDLSLNFNGVAGNQIFNNTARAFSSAQALGSNKENVIVDFLDPREKFDGSGISTSSRFLENGSFLRLNNASIGYNWDATNIDWMKSLRLYVTGQNLFVITGYSGYDPEVNSQGGNVYGVDFGSFPSTRTILFGLSVSIN